MENNDGHSEEAPSQKSMSVGKQWCLKCRNEASGECSLAIGHTHIPMETSPPEYCLQIQELRDKNDKDIANIIEKRGEAKKYFNDVSNALKQVEDEVKRMEKENDLHLSKMVSILMEEPTNINESSSIESLATKIKECAKVVEQELAIIKRLQSSYLNNLKNTKITLQFKDPDGKIRPTEVPVFDEGFSPGSGQQGQPKTLAVVSHILLSLLKSRTKIKKVLPPSPSSQTSIIEATPRIEKTIINEIDFRYFVFSMNFFHREYSLGTILVRPDSRFYRPFVDSLAQFCQKSKDLAVKINNGLPNSFAVVEFSHSLFKLSIPKLEELMLRQWEITVAPQEEDSMDVRFINFSNEGDNTITTFQLEFMLHQTRKEQKRYPFFGRIVKGKEVANNLSRLPAITHVTLSRDHALQRPEGLLTFIQESIITTPKVSAKRERNRCINLNNPDDSYRKLVDISRDSVFAMKCSRNNRHIGTVLVKPDKKFYKPFMDGLKQFCQSTVTFSGKIDKVSPDSFVTVQFSHPNFKHDLTTSSDLETFLSNAPLPLESLDVGIFDFSFKGKNVNEFRLIFLLEPCNPENVRDCILFGKIVGGSKEVIQELSLKDVADYGNFTLSVEFGF